MDLISKIYDTVALDEQENKLVIIDQTLLPNEECFLALDDEDEIIEAIQKLRVRGAPAIGVAAAIGLYVCACRLAEDDPERWRGKILAIKERIAHARPTAVNLTWALNRMERVLLAHPDASIENMKRTLHNEACAIRDEDVDVCRRIGQHGAQLIADGDGILTHCNAGRLAAVRYGTALAPIYTAREEGKQIHVYVDETRPLLQGARLTAYELASAGINTTLQCDNMAASLMASGRIQSVFVGCDRVAANGDTANKIGTLGVAILAKYFKIPFYVCAPTSTIDPSCVDGSEIIIESRAAEEVTQLWYRERMAPNQIQVYNPAFDVAPRALITAWITEKGIVRDGSQLAQLV